MGTSSSNSGPRGKTPLLPKWAQGGGEGASPGSPTPAPPAPDGGNGDSPSSEPTPKAVPDKIQAQQAAPLLPKLSGAPWTLARRAMTSAVKAGATAAGLRTAGRRYVSAKGGAKKASSTATAGRATTARIGNFVSDIASRGFNDAARAIGLESTVGRKVDVVLAEVINAIAPAGTNNDDAIARRAASETLRELFEKHGVEQAGLDALSAMTPADVTDTIELSVAAYVYERWLFDLSQKIEQNAVSEADAVKLERDVKDFVKGLVKLKLNGDQALRLDWKGAEGKEFVQEIYDAAYKLLGGTS
jgi:hypothetical protein